MDITKYNFIQELTYTINELVMVSEQFKTIEQDTPANHDRILLLNGRMGAAMKHLPAIITFIATHKPYPAIVDGRLSKAVRLMSEIFREKTRILNNTPQIFKDTNDMSALN